MRAARAKPADHARPFPLPPPSPPPPSRAAARGWPTSAPGPTRWCSSQPTPLWPLRLAPTPTAGSPCGWSHLMRASMPSLHRWMQPTRCPRRLPARGGPRRLRRRLMCPCHRPRRRWPRPRHHPRRRWFKRLWAHRRRRRRRWWWWECPRPQQAHPPHRQPRGSPPPPPHPRRCSPPPHPLLQPGEPDLSGQACTPCAASRGLAACVCLWCGRLALFGVLTAGGL